MPDQVTGAAVLFDLDGVLVDSEAQEEAAVTDLLTRAGAQLEGWEVARAVRCTPRTERAGRLAELDPCRPYQQLLQEYFAQERPPILDAPPMPGAADALTLVMDARLPMAVATNAPVALARQRLRNAGLDRFGLPVFSARDLGAPKPAPDVFDHARRGLGAAPHRTAVIEDSLPGTLAAVAAGIPVFVVHDIGPLPEGCHPCTGILDATRRAIEHLTGSHRR